MSPGTSVINRFIGAIDQGTSSTKFIVYNHQGLPVGSHQLEHKQLIPEPGLVEHDPLEIWVRSPCCCLCRTMSCRCLGQK